MSSMQGFVFGAIVLALNGCSPPPAAKSAGESERFTQVSIINALMLGQYDGVMPISELLTYGDFGLGTCDHLDGELIILDGQAYQAKADGSVVLVAGHTTTPFALVTPFQQDGLFIAPTFPRLLELESRLDQAMAAQDLFFAVRVDADFDSITLRSVPRQEPPYAALADVAKKQAVWTHEKIKGTLVGVRCPKWVGGINVPGYHWHFLSADRKIGGHVLDCRSQSATVAYDRCESWYVKLADAGGKDLGQDLTHELEQVERLRGSDKKPQSKDK